MRVVHVGHEVQDTSCRSSDLGATLFCERLVEVLGQHVLEDWLQVSTHHHVVIEVEALEYALVEVAARLTGGGEVMLVCLTEECEHTIELLFEVLFARLSVSQLAFGASLGERDAVLLDLEDVEIDRVGVVSLEQLGALRLQGSQPSLSPLAGLRLIGEHRLQVFPDDVANPLTG